MFQRQRPGSRFGRKRHQDSLATEKQSKNLVFEDPDLPAPSNNVVDDVKVKQYIHKLTVPEDQNGAACMKIVMSNSECEWLSESLQEELQQEFGASSISVSARIPLNVDRIVTVYGDLQQTLSVVLFIAFVLNSRLNNVTKVEPFTLKSQNYRIDVLVECTSTEMSKLASRFPEHSLDYSEYNGNRNLHIATLSGDFLSLFNSLVYIYLRHSFSTYSLDSSIKFLNVIGVHDNTQSKHISNDEVLQYVYGRSFLSS